MEFVVGLRTPADCKFGSSFIDGPRVWKRSSTIPMSIATLDLLNVLAHYSKCFTVIFELPAFVLALDTVP